MKRIVGNALTIENAVVVHGCNARGVMGSGFAKEVKERYPSAFLAYREDFEAGGLDLGSITYVEPRRNFLLVNAITQKNYGYDGQLYLDYEALKDSMLLTASLAKQKDLPLCFPLIGCDRGGGDWNIVRQIIEDAAAKFGVETILYTLDHKPLPGGPNIEPTQLTAKERPKLK